MQAWRLPWAIFFLAVIIALPFHCPALAQSEDPPGEPVLSPYWRPAVTRWEPMILQEAQRRNLDPDLVAALIWKESMGRPTASGPVGAVGLMMVMPFPWRPSPEELMDPWTNLFWGTRALAHTIRDGNGDMYYSLAAYNGSWKQIHLRVTRRYATFILDEYTRAVAVRHGLPADGEWLALFAVEGTPGPKTITVLGPHHPLTRYTERPWGQVDIPTTPSGLPPDATVITFVNEQGTECRVNLWLITDDAASLASDSMQPLFLPPPAGYRVGGQEAISVTPTWADLPTAAPTFTPTMTITPTMTATPTPMPSPPVTPTATATPTLTPPPATPTATVIPTPTPTITLTPPADCEYGPLLLDAWYLDRAFNDAGGWTTSIFVQGHGGDCLYTYAWNGEIKGGPMFGSMIFEISHTDRSAVIMGTASVISAGETAEVGLFIKPPDSD